MAEHPIQGLMGVTIEKIRDMVNAETIIGDPIHVDDTTIIRSPASPSGLCPAVPTLAPAPTSRCSAAAAVQASRSRRWHSS